MKVRQAMSSHVVTVAPGDQAWAAGELLARLEITGLPVVDADRHVLGMITQLDMIRAVRRGNDLRTMTVGQIMQPYPMYVEPESDIDAAAELMEEWPVHRLPVCQHGRLVGIVSRGDVLRCMLLGCVQA